MGYSSILTSIENITKTVQRLLNYQRQTFYRRTREIIETEVMLLLEIKHWLGTRIKELFNPAANIITSQESNKNNNLLKPINAGHISEKETHN